MTGKSGTFGTGRYMFFHNIVSADEGGRDVASYAFIVAVGRAGSVGGCLQNVLQLRLES